ncbi:MAG: Radical SAM superfamily enzyme YgiQ [Candidatus Alkanophagales archaeon MCA70_species_1]|nr:Radical SAM superfamily enzyme YgiQ [Candidatus Alkanophaga volatiphilum]
MKFERRSVEEVKQDIKAAKIFYHAAYGRAPKTAFIGDSDSPIIKTEDFVEILKFLRAEIPSLRRVTSYARAKTIYRKKEEYLRALREAGLTRLHLGLETGSDELLRRVKKGATAEEMIKAGRKAKAVGFEISEYVILGLGGREFFETREHALETARVLNEINPHFIRFRTLVPLPGTPIYEKYVSGELELLTPHEVLKEALTIIENLEVESWVSFDHISNPYPIPDAKLPEEKEHLLEDLRFALSLDETQLTDAKQLICRGYL